MNSVSTATKLAPACRAQNRDSASVSVITVIVDAIHRKYGGGNPSTPILIRSNCENPVELRRGSGPARSQKRGSLVALAGRIVDRRYLHNPCARKTSNVTGGFLHYFI